MVVMNMVSHMTNLSLRLPNDCNCDDVMTLTLGAHTDFQVVGFAEILLFMVWCFLLTTMTLT